MDDLCRSIHHYFKYGKKVKEELSYSSLDNWNLSRSAVFLLCMAPAVNYMLLFAPAATLWECLQKYHQRSHITVVWWLQITCSRIRPSDLFPSSQMLLFPHMQLTGLAWTWLDSTSLCLISTMNMKVASHSFMFGKIDVSSMTKQVWVCKANGIRSL